MGFLSRLLGLDEPQRTRASNARGAYAADNAHGPVPGDEQALERYRYMMRTAPPETIEQAHREAFATLTPEHRRQVLAELARAAPAQERAAVESTSPDDAGALARVATRAEIRQPGLMERTLGGGGGMGGGMLGGMGGSLLGSFAAGFVGSMVAQSFFSALGGGLDFGGGAGEAETATGETADNADADYQDGFDSGGDGLDGGGDGFDGGDFDV